MKIQQTEIARRIGCDRGYLSCLENDQRPAPTRDFLEKLIVALDLRPHEADKLRAARSMSSREFHLPGNLPPEAYVLCYELVQRIDRLSPSHLSAMIEVAKIEDAPPRPIASAHPD